MKLPRGTPVKSDELPRSLGDLNAMLLKSVFTGYMRASLISKPGESVEGVIVYSKGETILAFTSDGDTDRQDHEMQLIASILAKEQAIIELCVLNDKQLQLMADFCSEFAIKAPQPAVPLKPEIKPEPPVRAQRPKKEAPSQAAPVRMPEVRGQFLRSEKVENLGVYLSSRTDETGHVILAIDNGGQYTEFHMFLVAGKVEAAYAGPSDAMGKPLLDSIAGKAGDVEYYHLDEAIIHSILHRYPWVATAAAPQPIVKLELKPEPAPKLEQPRRSAPILKPDFPALQKPSEMQPSYAPPSAPQPMSENPRPGLGIPARALLEKADRQAYSVEGLGTPVPEVKSASSLKGDMDEDIDYVKKIEHEFVGNVDELLKRLELTHLRAATNKKKK